MVSVFSGLDSVFSLVIAPTYVPLTYPICQLCWKKKHHEDREDRTVADLNVCN